MEDNWSELFESVSAFFVQKNGLNEDTYSQDGCERMWEVVAAGISGRYSLNRYADEVDAVKAFKAEYEKYAERKKIEWEKWETILLAPNE